MDDDFEGELSLQVTIAAEEWSFTRRRLRFLEAVLVQILRERGRLREWYTAAELAALHLPGLPTTRQGIGRLAFARNWRRRIGHGQGGERYLYHCASLPGRAFDSLIDRIMTAPVIEPATSVRVPAPPPPRRPQASTTAPPWVLPLMRILRSEPDATVEAAVRELPRLVPMPAGCPTPDEAREVLRAFGKLALADR